ncbi:MAG: phage tail assembly protein [Devosia sp.]
MSEPITVSLSEPVTHGKESYSSLTFTRTTRGKDLVAMDAVQGDIRKSFALFASMAGVPLQVFLEMSTEDYEEVARAAAPLMGKRGATAMLASQPAADSTAI